MRLKAYLKEKRISVYSISQKTGVPYSNICDIVNGRTDIGHVRLDTAMKIADELEMTVEELYCLCREDSPVLEDGRIVVVNKQYYLQYRNRRETTTRYLCKATALNRRYIEFLAGHVMEAIRREEALEQWNPHSAS